MIPSRPTPGRKPAPVYKTFSQSFLSAGTFSFVCPNGAVSLYIVVNGAGGGGQGGLGYDCNDIVGTGDGNGGYASFVKRGATVLSEAAGGIGGGGTGTAAEGPSYGPGLTIIPAGGSAAGAGGAGLDLTNGDCPPDPVAGGPGTNGDSVVGTISVTPGETLTAIAGASPAGVSNGGVGSNGTVTFSWTIVM